MINLRITEEMSTAALDYAHTSRRIARLRGELADEEKRLFKATHTIKDALYEQIGDDASTVDIDDAVMFMRADYPMPISVYYPRSSGEDDVDEGSDVMLERHDGD